MTTSTTKRYGARAMVLVDTSVWVDVFRDASGSECGSLKDVIGEDDVDIVGASLLAILHVIVPTAAPIASKLAPTRLSLLRKRNTNDIIGSDRYLCSAFRMNPSLSMRLRASG